MPSWGRGFTTTVAPYRDNLPDEDGDVVCAGCGGVFGDLAELRAAGLSAYPEKCRECRAADRERRGAPFAGAPSTWRGMERRAHAPAESR